MKLATLQDGSRDGQLVVVSRDLAAAHYATGIANRLQQVLDDWGFMAPQLQDLADRLDAGRARHAFAFDPAQCLAPLPRAFERVDGQAWPSPGDATGTAAVDAAMPLLHPRAGELLGPCHPIEVASEAMGVDFGAGLAVVTGDVRRGATPARTLEGIRLVLLVNDIRLHHVPAVGRDRGAATPQGRPATAFGPVAVTPDELGGAWRDGRAHLALQTTWNGRKVGQCDTGEDMRAHFGELVAHLAATRPVRAGTLVGGGTVGHPGVVRKDGRTDWPRGHAGIAERRAAETLRDGRPTTEFMRFGDTVRIEAKGPDGRSVFGAIEQEVVAADAAVERGQGLLPGA
jgi:fumarylacetoacetate (FAA) hydrolase